MREKSEERIKMQKSKRMQLPVLLGLLMLSPAIVLGNIQSTSTTTSSSVATPNPDLETCQCGVFLLGLEPLVFSAEAKPILSGIYDDTTRRIRSTSHRMHLSQKMQFFIF
jgi:hypothetical protein